MCGAGYIVDDNFIEETTEADLFASYYMTLPNIYKSFTGQTPDANNKVIAWDSDKERYLSWTYHEIGDFVHWKMYCNNVPYGDEVPILPGLKIVKCVVNS